MQPPSNDAKTNTMDSMAPFVYVHLVDFGCKRKLHYRKPENQESHKPKNRFCHVIEIPGKLSEIIFEKFYAEIAGAILKEIMEDFPKESLVQFLKTIHVAVFLRKHSMNL